MARFSPTEAALTGFRVVREHPKALIGWAILQFIQSFSAMLILATMAGPTMARLQAPGFDPFGDPSAVLALAKPLIPAELLALLVSLVTSPLLCAALNRAVLQPHDSGFAFVRLGRAELLQLGLKLIVLALGAAGIVSLAVVLSTIGALAETLGSGAGMALGGLLLFCAAIAGVGAAVFVTIRLSLASAMTFATGRISLAGCWTLTRGHFWSLFATFALATGLAIVVLLFGLVFTSSVMSLVAGGLKASPGGFQPDLSSPAAFLRPAQLLNVALISALYGLASPLIVTPAATLYLALAGGGAASAPPGSRANRLA